MMNGFMGLTASLLSRHLWRGTGMCVKNKSIAPGGLQTITPVKRFVWRRCALVLEKSSVEAYQTQDHTAV